MMGVQVEGIQICMKEFQSEGIQYEFQRLLKGFIFFKYSAFHAATVFQWNLELHSG